jgi:Zn-finger nucleic acid-binding protein
MAPTTTARDVCRHCGNEWRPGWERCRRCGATLRNRITASVANGEVREDSGLELDRRRRTPPKETNTAKVPRVEQAEAPTRELSPEPGPPADPSTRIAVVQVLTGALGVALLAQLLAPSVLPTLTGLVVHTLRGERVSWLSWALGALPWVLTGTVLGLALGVAQSVAGRSLVRSPIGAAVLAVLPGPLLVGWPALHDHLVSALVRRGGRKPAALLTGWSRAVLGCISAAVILTLLDGLGVLPLPPAALAAVKALAVASRQGHLCALAITLPVLLLRPGRRGAPLPSQLVCPQCGGDAPTLQRFRDGLAGSACSRCAGALLGPGQVSTLLSMAKVEDATYRREIRLGSTGTRPLHCPQCGSAMRGVQLRTVTAHGCPACGSLWLDRLGLARLTGGRAMPTSAPARPVASPARVWPVAAAMATLLIAALPWVAVGARWCHPDAGACTSVSVPATRK